MYNNGAEILAGKVYVMDNSENKLIENIEETEVVDEKADTTDNEDVAEKEDSLKSKIMKEVFYWIKTVAIILVVAFVLNNFVFTVAKVDGISMEPTLQDSDRLIIWRLAYEPKVGDIVVFEPDIDDDRQYWIKRVIATEGQHVEIDYETSSVYVDNVKIDEPYLGEPMEEMGATPIKEIDVPEDCVFVMGDNRNNSTDGRALGAIHKDKILGKSVLRFWPLDKFSTY